MRLTAYRLSSAVPVLRPATPRRDWMDETDERYAYRCLPLTMGNQFGWELLCPATFEAMWTGGRGLGSVQVVRLGGNGEIPASHFGHGVLTFDPCHLFRTDAPFQMYVTGPLNAPKDGIAPLTGLVETDWLPFLFTMNWRFTRPGVPVRFEEGEPFCHFFPVLPSTLEAVDPVLCDLDQDAEVAGHYHAWKQSRDAWCRDLHVEGTVANREGWQRFYHRGLLENGQPGAGEHRTRMRLCPFHEGAPAAAQASGIQGLPVVVENGMVVG